MHGFGGKVPLKASRNPNIIDGSAVGLPSSSNTNPIPNTANITMNFQTANSTNSNLKGKEDNNGDPNQKTAIARSASGKRIKVNLIPTS